MLRRRGVETVILAGADTHGIMRGRRADRRPRDRAPPGGCWRWTALSAPRRYRRLTPYSWAATTATWSVDNRSAGLRAIGDGDAIARVEHRQAGADANPYLAAAAALAAGLDGVRRACEPPPPVDGDVYALADGAVPALPLTLGAATDLLERSALAREWLGDDVVDHCVAMRRAELAAQSAAVTDWETARYLEAL